MSAESATFSRTSWPCVWGGSCLSPDGRCWGREGSGHWISTFPIPFSPEIAAYLPLPLSTHARSSKLSIHVHWRGSGDIAVGWKSIQPTATEDVWSPWVCHSVWLEDVYRTYLQSSPNFLFWFWVSNYGWTRFLCCPNSDLVLSPIYRYVAALETSAEQNWGSTGSLACNASHKMKIGQR